MRTAFILAAAATPEPTEGEAKGSVLIPEPADLIWGTIAFLIVLAVIIWVVLPRVNKMLDERRDAIEGSIERAAQAQAEAEAARASFTDQLAEARAEAAKIRDTARTDAQKIAAEVKDQAQADAARIVANAQAQIEAERQAAIVSLKAQVGTLAIDAATKVIGEAVDDAKASAIVDRFLAEIEAEQTGSAK